MRCQPDASRSHVSNAEAWKSVTPAATSRLRVASKASDAAPATGEVASSVQAVPFQPHVSDLARVVDSPPLSTVRPRDGSNAAAALVRDGGALARLNAVTLTPSHSYTLFGPSVSTITRRWRQVSNAIA